MQKYKVVAIESNDRVAVILSGRNVSVLFKAGYCVCIYVCRRKWSAHFGCASSIKREKKFSVYFRKIAL